jgi:hypothetical protein
MKNKRFELMLLLLPLLMMLLVGEMSIMHGLLTREEWDE